MPNTGEVTKVKKKSVTQPGSLVYKGELEVIATKATSLP